MPAAAITRDAIEVYDSGSVAGGALIDSGVLNLAPFSELSVIVDNTLGTTLRDLQLLSFRPDGTTQIDSLVLRRCGFGAAPTGSLYAPGAQRGYVGPNPPGGTAGTHVLYDVTSGLNAALDSGAIATEDVDGLTLTSEVSGGTSQPQVLEVDDAGNSRELYRRAADANPGAGSLGLGAAVGSVGGGVALGFSLPIAVPRRVRVQMTAAGVGFTTRVRIIGRGRVPGTFAVQLALPTKGQFKLLAAGATAARLTILGRV